MNTLKNKVTTRKDADFVDRADVLTDGARARTAALEAENYRAWCVSVLADMPVRISALGILGMWRSQGGLAT